MVSQIGYNLLHASDWLNASGEVVPAGTAGAAPRSWSSGINAALFVNAIGSWLGGRLAMDLLEPETIGGQLGAAIGQTYGEGAKLLFQILLPGIGAFIGYIVGGLIGSLFGGTAKSGASLGWSEAEQEYSVANVWSKSAGSKDAARSFASSVAELLNGVIDASGSRVIDAGGVQTGAYELKGSRFIYKTSASGAYAFASKDVSEIITHGQFIALSDLSTRLMGGDVYVKRALLATLSASGGNPNLDTAFSAEALGNGGE